MDNKNTVVLVNNELRHDYVLQLPRESPPTSVPLLGGHVGTGVSLRKPTWLNLDLFMDFHVCVGV